MKNVTSLKEPQYNSATMRSHSGLLLLVVLLTCGLVNGDAYFETLYEMMVDAKESLKDIGVNINKGLKTVAETVKFIETFIDSTVEEDCVFKCPRKKVKVKKESHIPQSNGCGSFGMFFEREDLPRAEMVDCCNDHDYCYDTCGSDKEECDRKFKRCLYKTCDTAMEKMNIITEKKCKGGAKLLYTATIALGCSAYKNAQKEACLCVDERDAANMRNEL